MEAIPLAKLTDNSNQLGMEDLCDLSPVPSVTSMTSHLSENTFPSSRSSWSGSECSNSSKKVYLDVEPCIIECLDLDDDSNADSDDDDSSFQTKPEIYSPLKTILDTDISSVQKQSPRKVQDNEEAILEYLHKTPVTLNDVKLLIPDFGNMRRLTFKLATNIGLWHSKNKISAAEVETILEYLFTAPQAGTFVQFENTHSSIATFINANEHDYMTLWAGADWEEARCPEFAPSLLNFEHEDGKKGFWYEKNVLFEKVKEQIDRFKRQRSDNRGQHYEFERLHGGYGVPEHKMTRPYLPRKEKTLNLRGVGDQIMPDPAPNVKEEETDGLHLSLRKSEVLREGDQYSFTQTAPSEAEADLFAPAPTGSLPAKPLANPKILPCIPLILTSRPKPAETKLVVAKQKPQVKLPSPTAYKHLSNIPIRPTPPLGRNMHKAERQSWAQTRSLRIQKYISGEAEKGKKPVVRLLPTDGKETTTSKGKANDQVAGAKTQAQPQARKPVNTLNVKVAKPDLKKPISPTSTDKGSVQKKKSEKKPEWMVAPMWGA